jgi:hypothetical protein
LGLRRPDFFGTIRDSRDNLFQGVPYRPRGETKTDAKLAAPTAQGLARVSGLLVAAMQGTSAAASRILACPACAKCRACSSLLATFTAA